MLPICSLGFFCRERFNDPAIQQVSAWEAAAERVGQQAEALSELAESHKRSLVELQDLGTAWCRIQVMLGL